MDDTDDGDDGLFAVWPENVEALSVFIALRRCWRFDGMTGHCYGIDRSSIESTFNMMRIKKKQYPDLLEKIMTMEDAALPVLNR